MITVQGEGYGYLCLGRMRTETTERYAEHSPFG